MNTDVTHLGLDMHVPAVLCQHALSILRVNLGLLVMQQVQLPDTGVTAYH